jgi:hypothetical protein
MKTREVEFEPVDPQGPVRRKKGSWLTGVGALLVVLVLVGASAVVFAQLSLHRQGQLKNQPAGKWVAVLHGYTLTSLVAADSNPSMVYACATHAQTYTPLPGLPPNKIRTGNADYTVLRSTDLGIHWQDVGSKANLGGSCQLAINPADGNELYVVSEVLSNGQTASVLKHSADGGATWTTIQPVLRSTGPQPTQATQAWHVQQLRMAGGHLFGVQWIARRILPVVFQGTPPKYVLPLTRLVTSVDGGHTWNVLDIQFDATRQETRAYAVDPTNSSTIYELVGMPWLPLQPRIVVPNDVSIPVGRGEDLYKTTDNGVNWHLLLKGLPFGALVHVEVARGAAQMIYAGGLVTPLPYILRAPVENGYGGVGVFDLQLSRDGGANWHAVPGLSRQASLQNWFAGANGEVFAYGFNVNAGTGGKGTVVASTAIVSTAVVTVVPAKTGTVPTGILSPDGGVSVASVPALPGGTPGFSVSIERYDPGTNAWSAVTSPPVSGTLLTLTPGGSGGDVLWFMGEDKGQGVLYRFVL